MDEERKGGAGLPEADNAAGRTAGGKAPSPARLAAAALAILLAALGLALAEGACFAAALPLAAWAAIGLFAPAPALRLEARRELSPSFAVAGRPIAVRIEVRNSGERIDCLVLEDSLPPGCAVAAGSTLWRGSLDAGAVAVIEYRLEAGRGVHRFESVNAMAETAFSGLRSVAELPVPGLAVVPPAPLPAQGPGFGAATTRPFSGLSREKRRGQGGEFAMTREYAPGDPLRSLNWRAEALWGESIVNVYEEEKALDVGIILDARAEAYPDLGLFEAAVSAAASVADELLDGGNRVAFLSYGAAVEWTAPGLGREQRLKVKLAAARASLGDHAVFERFDNLPVGLFPPRSAIVLVSPLLRDDLVATRSLAALGYRVAVIRPDPSMRRDQARGAAGNAAADGTLSAEAGSRTVASPGEGSAEDTAARRFLELETRYLLDRLRAAGVTVLTWRPGTPLAPLLAGRRAGG